jgi:hypothetical protein
MTKEFVPYDLAIQLKNLGFDFPCLGYYHNTLGSDNAGLFIKETTTEIYEMINLPEDIYTLAPLYQQASRWFREKYGLVCYVKYDSGIFEAVTDGGYYSKFNTFQEAELACLKKLIQLIKGK